MTVIADTSVINYLVLIEEINILQKLYRTVLLPAAVLRELRSSFAPLAVRTWAEAPPEWVQPRVLKELVPFADSQLGAGEREAISLAMMETASLLLLDDSRARFEAERLGIETRGTLGVLQEAHFAAVLSLESAVTKLQQTNFKASAALYDRVLQSVKSREET